MSNYMFILWTINKKCKIKGKRFLINTFLKPKFKFFDYDYSFNANGEIVKMTLRHKTDASKNELDRYVRIAFEAINDYNNKENRSLKHSLDKADLILLNRICNLINAKTNDKVVQKQLENLVVSIQNKLIEKNLS